MSKRNSNGFTVTHPPARHRKCGSTFRHEAVTRAHLPSRRSGGFSAPRRPTEARCNERSHPHRCGRFGLCDPGSDPGRSSDSSVSADLSRRTSQRAAPGLATNQVPLASHSPRRHSACGRFSHSSDNASSWWLAWNILLGQAL
jgi:hypothetical protein